MIIDNQNSVVLKQLKNNSRIDKNKLLRSSIELHQKFILDMNRKQLRSGIKSDGRFIEPDYSVSYLNYKLSLPSYKAPGGIPDLYDTGTTQENMIIDIAHVQYLIYSTSSRSDSLELRYGSEIYGLIPANLIKAQNKVTPDYNHKYHLELNK